MTLEELRQQIREKVILYEGDIAPYKWGEWGLLDKATEVGIDQENFLRLVQEVSRSISFPKISDLCHHIKNEANKKGKQFNEEDLESFIFEADALKLSREFILYQWLPKILNVVPSIVVQPLKACSSAKSRIAQTDPNENNFENSTETINEKQKAEIDPVSMGFLETDRGSYNGHPTNVDLNGTKSFTNRPIAEVPKEPVSIVQSSKLIIFKKYALGLVAIIGICIVIYALTRSKSLEINRVKSILQQQKDMDKLLVEGRRLAENGDYQDANIKFRKAIDYTSNKELNTELLKEYASDFTQIGNEICDDVKSPGTIKMANNFYKHAAILSKTKQKICQ